jgi:plasmid stabilization system protein ParE
VTVSVRPNADAEEDFRYYIRWYENESAGLGERLWSEIQAAIDLIADHPLIGEVVRRRGVRESVRRVPLRHFPFLLVYRERPDHYEIVALAHTSRNPRQWRRRLN